MYVTTFYSFKGGVGRTMALVNSAVELANRGRRVVAVDFDLEAPGLDSFGILRPGQPGPGLVDFVHQYLESGRSPDARDFMYRARNVGDKGGELWIMPAGAGRKDYQERFRKLDWMEVYDRYDGYLLFEDLKAQWDKALEADWVFVDSRTGHTDTGGICTRQLPDAVVVVFFPNEQNRRGLKAVVREIRAEADTARKKRIELHFVMSHVPDLDDEDAILRKQTLAFQEELAMRRPPVIVHRYDSLALLNQAVFVQERPRSRLAREYQEVVRRIVAGNLEDRDGALAYIRESPRARRRFGRDRREPMQERREQLDRIEKMHASDAELLYEVANFYERQRSAEDAVRLFNLAIEAGCTEPDAILFRSRFRARTGDPDGASQDALRVLQNEDANPGQLVEALSLSSAPVELLLDTLTERELDAVDLSWIGTGLIQRDQRSKGVAVLESFSLDALPERLRWDPRHYLSLAYLALGRCAEAASVLADQELDVEDSLRMVDSFNYAMARWGATGGPDAVPFQRVVALSAQIEGTDDPNRLQCLAVAYWASGNEAAANERLAAAREAVENGPMQSLLSCWRYRNVSRTEFEEDLEDMRALFEGDVTRRPRFFPEPEASPVPAPAS